MIKNDGDWIHDCFFYKIPISALFTSYEKYCFFSHQCTQHHPSLRTQQFITIVPNSLQCCTLLTIVFFVTHYRIFTTHHIIRAGTIPSRATTSSASPPLATVTDSMRALRPLSVYKQKFIKMLEIIERILLCGY